MGFGSPADIDITFAGEEERRHVEVKVDRDRREKLPLYFDGESISGKVSIRLKDGKRLEHNGIKVEFVGDIGTLPLLLLP